MRKKISMLLVFALLFSAIVPCYAADNNYDTDYIKFQNALKSIENGKFTPEEKLVLRNLISNKYEYIVAKKSGINVDMPNKDFSLVQTRSLPPFELIALYEQSVEDVRFTANKLMAYGSLSGGLGYFASKVPYIGTGATAAGATFAIAGALLYLSTGDLEDESLYTGENWFRWTDEENYYYEVYTKTYVTYDGERISKISQSGIIEGDFDS